MAKKKGEQSKPAGESTQVRIDPEIARMAKVVALEDGVSVTKYISDYLRPKVIADYRRVQAAGAEKLKQMDEEVNEEAKPKGKGRK